MTIDCGVKDHESTCLCDVVITDPVEILDGSQLLGSVYSEYVLRAFGPELLDSPDTLIDYLDALAKAKDAVEARKASAHGGCRGVTPEDVADLHAWLLSGNSIVDYHADWDDTLRLLTSGHPSPLWAFTEWDFVKLEGELYDLGEGAGSHAIAKATGVSRTVAKKLRRYYFGVAEKL